LPFPTRFRLSEERRSELEAQSTVVRDLLWEMEESTMISEPLITFDKLVIKIAIMLRNVQGAAKKAAKEVNSTALSTRTAR